MILCLDVGNTHIFGGVFKERKRLLHFRYESRFGGTSDQLGVFLKNLIRENELEVDTLSDIAICSVVPSMDYSLQAACKKYFNIKPFILKAGVKTGLNIKYQNPLEVGADRIANAISAVQRFPDQPLIIVDFGTATTLCAISAQKSYLGGVIMPGIRLSMEALQSNTAKLMPVEIIQPNHVLGRSTAAAIQSGLYYGQLFAVKEMIALISQQYFENTSPVVIATGGFCNLFENEQFFKHVQADLVLEGLVLALEMNR